MIPKNHIPLIRLKVNSNGNIHIPKSLRDEYGVKHKSELVVGLFELLQHGEISQIPTFNVKFV